MRTEQLYYALEAAKTGSFTKAADNLFLKQPGLRAAITALEEELGFKIFNRTATGVVLTNEGERAIPIFKNMVKEYELLKMNIVKSEYDQTPCLSVSVALAGEQAFWEPSFNMMRVLYPEVKINSFVGNSYAEQLQWLLEKKIDIAVLCTAGAVLANDTYYYSLKNHAYTIEKISSYKIKILVLKSHPLAARKNIGLEDLCKYTFMFRATGDKPIQKYLSYKIENFKDAKCIFLSNQAFEAQYIFEANGMYCYLEGAVADNIPIANNLVALQLKEDLEVDFYLSYRIDDQKPMTAVYADIIRKLATNF